MHKILVKEQPKEVEQFVWTEHVEKQQATSNNNDENNVRATYIVVK